MQVGSPLSIVRSNLALVVGIFVAVIASTIAVLQSREDVYRARAMIVLTLSETSVNGVRVPARSNRFTLEMADTEVSAMMSRGFAEEVAYKLSLFDPQGEEASDNAGAESADLARSRFTVIVDDLLASYSVFRKGSSLAVEIDAEATDPQLAADIANAVAATYVGRSLQTPKAKIAQSIDHYGRRVEDIGRSLSEEEVALADFTRDHDLDDDLLPVRLRDEEDQLRGILRLLADSPDDRARRTQIIIRLGEIDAVLQRRAEAELERRSREEDLSLLEARFQTAREDLGELETQAKFVNYGANQATLAVVPTRAVSPNREVVLLFAVVGAATLAFVAALLAEAIKLRRWTALDVPAITGLKCLSVLPPPAARWLGLLRLARHEDALAARRTSHSLLSVILRPNSGDGATILMVTSPLPCQRKSQVASDLAKAAAHAGMRSLLICMDQKEGKPGIGHLAARPPLALADVLADQATVFGAVEKASDGPDLLSLRSQSFVGQQQLAALRTKMIAPLKGQYDLVVLDVPPALVLNDAVTVGSLADVSVIVADRRRTDAVALADCASLVKGNQTVCGVIVIDRAVGRTYGRSIFAKRSASFVPARALAIGVAAVFAACVLASATLAQQDGLAFPGAAGFGRVATGWKGGEIVVVRSLADSGPGTLRSCAENSGIPRVCVFEVSGTIALFSPIIVGSNLYIAGQTAPGDGIQLRMAGAKSGPLVLFNVNDVVIRFLKLRPGPSRTPSPTVDALSIENGTRIYLGNLSMMFSTDEIISIHVSGSTSSDITLANSIIALSLDRANHPKGRHSKGALICSHEDTANACGRITLWRNLFAHNRDRNPDVKGTSLGPTEIINNVFYDPISQFGEIYDLLGDVSVAYVGNIALSGPSTIDATPPAIAVFDTVAEHGVTIAVHDNLAIKRRQCDVGRPFAVFDESVGGIVSALQVEGLSAPAVAADQTLELVLATAGDRLPGARGPDALDAQVLADVKDCTGRVINAPEDVGGWPQMKTALAPADRDRDKLPDYWEEMTPALDPDRLTDVWAVDPETGLSHIETYLAALAGDKS
jgi:uncharacterized protein involved in exopolysaccharide biosynthesis/Mrp family chromosome partitioning ATPase/pectate lyase